MSEFQELGPPCIPHQVAIVVRKTDDGIEIVQDGDPIQAENQIIEVTWANVPALLACLQAALKSG
jgi:hypothetical protein